MEQDQNENYDGITKEQFENDIGTQAFKALMPTHPDDNPEEQKNVDNEEVKQNVEEEVKQNVEEEVKQNAEEMNQNAEDDKNNQNQLDLLKMIMSKEKNLPNPNVDNDYQNEVFNVNNIETPTPGVTPEGAQEQKQSKTMGLLSELNTQLNKGGASKKVTPSETKDLNDDFERKVQDLRKKIEANRANDDNNRLNFDLNLANFTKENQGTPSKGETPITPISPMRTLTQAPLSTSQKYSDLYKMINAFQVGNKDPKRRPNPTASLRPANSNPYSGTLLSENFKSKNAKVFESDKFSYGQNGPNMMNIFGNNFLPNRQSDYKGDVKKGSFLDLYATGKYSSGVPKQSVQKSSNLPSYFSSFGSGRGSALSGSGNKGAYSKFVSNFSKANGPLLSDTYKERFNKGGLTVSSAGIGSPSRKSWARADYDTELHNFRSHLFSGYGKK